MRKIVAPLALLASITLLTSCTKKQETPAVTPTPVETQSPVMQDGVPPTPPSPPVPPAPPAPPAPTPIDTNVPPAPPAPVDAPAAPQTSTVAPVARTETVKYNTPAGGDSIEFSVTVTDGVITAATATPKAENEISKKLQEGFTAKLSESVVGKKAKDLDVAAIGGASLATNAFEIFVHSF